MYRNIKGGRADTINSTRSKDRGLADTTPDREKLQYLLTAVEVKSERIKFWVRRKERVV